MNTEEILKENLTHDISINDIKPYIEIKIIGIIINRKHVL